MAKFVNSLVVKNDMVVNGSVKATGFTANSDGDMVVGKDLEVDGNIKYLDKIVDEDDNPRFVEGDGLVANSNYTGIYNKWSLSGSHLMIVACCSIASGTPTAGSIVDTVTYTLPDWIMDKIYPVSGVWIETKDVRLVNAETTTRKILDDSHLVKENGKLRVRIHNTTSYATEEVLYFRIQFDLLIDTD